MTKIETADRINILICIVLAADSNSTNIENLVKFLCPCPGMRPFMIVTKKLLLSGIEIKHYITLLNQDRFYNNFAYG